MADTEHAESVDPKKIYDRAREVLKAAEESKGSNSLLLSYNPDTERFQFLAIHADPEEVYALLLSGMSALKDIVKDIDIERTLN